MKKILFLLLMLCSITVALAAGTGDGSKEHPYTGEWQASELGPKLKKGDYLAFDCVIKDVELTVIDSKLNQEVAHQWTAWSPGNHIDNPKTGPYKQYGDDNPPENRKRQSFILTDVSPSAKTSTEFTITGYFSGFYRIPDDDGFVRVATTEQMWKILSDDAHAKIMLTQDIALSDIDKDYETYCKGNTFYGTIDGDGHTIKGDPQKDVRARTYMFSNSDGATFKNLTFKGIRVNSQSDSNQAIITSKAQNGCVFENITFDNVHTFSDWDNAAAVAGSAEGCTFINITVKNSDFTVDRWSSGAVVGYAKLCTFTNIEVKNCESTSDNARSGGVVGDADSCRFNGVKVFESFIKSYGVDVGGITGNSNRSHYTNCIIDDQSCVCSDGSSTKADVGGIVGYSQSGEYFYNCINSALIAADGDNAGGIVGWSTSGKVFEGCLNTGMVINITMDEVKNGFYNNYKNKTNMTCVTKTYQGKEYVIRNYTGEPKGSSDNYGGIVGNMPNGTISKCANLGCVNVEGSIWDIIGSCGGIAGNFYGTISDCLCDFYGSSDVKGIFGKLAKGSTVKNCLNSTTHDEFSNYGGGTEDTSGENNYSLTTQNDGLNITKTTEYDIKSGKICLLLGEAWEQNLGTDACPTPTGDRGLYHQRGVTMKDYGTVCLPYPLASHETFTAKKEREYYIFKEATNEADGTMSLRFEYADEVPAGTPAIFRAYVNSDYDFEASAKVYDFELKPTVCSDWTFNGTYEQKVFEGNDAKSIYYLDGTYKTSAIKNAKKITIAPYRAYFSGPSIEALTAAGAKSIRFVIEDEDGETTALESVGCDLVPVQNNGKTYSIMGTEVNNNYRGIVISNGKKILRK